MLANVTPAVSRAWEAAQQWCRRQGASAILPEHLLWGLLEEEEGRAATVLARFGLASSEGARVEGAAISGQGSGDRGQTADPRPLTPDPSPLQISPLTQTILDHARDLAHENSPDRVVTSDELLLALLRSDSALRQSLELQGLAFDKLETAILGPPETPLPLDEPLSLGHSTEEIDSARILDAGANRAREAIRILEDYCRFALDDAFLSGELKRLRHQLREVLSRLPVSQLLEARETLRDVGTAIATPAERERSSVVAVVQANCKRLEEALRSLEEFGKLRDPQIGIDLEQMRYRAYTLERIMILSTTARRRLAEVRLYLLVTGSLCQAALDWTIYEAAEGGVQMVQLREKALSDRDLLERARQVRRWTRKAGVLFIMNDRPDLARLAEADGVHLGQDDMPVKEARRILGPDALIGVSTHDLDQVRQAVLDGASYVGVGPTFPSGTKGFTDFPGLEFARQAALFTSLPAFVIGGVSVDNVDRVIAAGPRRVAVSQAICRAEEPRQVASALRQRLDSR
jgi:thiamine-phosphate pyrophosphorylase